MTALRIDGRSLAVTEAGAGPALLLLHGFTGTSSTWSGVMAACRVDHRVIVPDLLGHGRSEAPADAAAYALECQADGLAALLESLKASPAHVVGYSMGARLALRLVVDHPHSIRSLVLESPSAGIADAVARARRRAADERRARQLELDGLVSFVEAWEAQRLFASHADLPEEARGRLRAERLSHDPRALAASLRGAGQGAMLPLHDRLGGIRCPVLVLAGALDPVGLARAHEVADAIPQARLQRIERSGHTPHLEQPEVVRELLQAFLHGQRTLRTH